MMQRKDALQGVRLAMDALRPDARENAHLAKIRRSYTPCACRLLPTMKGSEVFEVVLRAAISAKWRFAGGRSDPRTAEGQSNVPGEDGDLVIQ
ncbi:hypothetical protein NDU88_001141 [Pleurodeles waltl]|uniref:Uncharacterized protein n=1 Tax=Pleurodeles waltl TaxID=8319 RepID=A0AAV7WND8_PLEWA|nr:hypothetical protein NDU88_001141 [Pleurodeles waltl]